MAGDIRIGVDQLAARTTTGTDDFTDVTALDGDTPNGALFIGGRGITNGTSSIDARLHIGAGIATGTEWVFSLVDQNNAATTNAERRYAVNEVLMQLQPGSVTGEANFDSLITNGARINWATNPLPGANLSHAVLFGGPDILVDVGTFIAHATVDTAQAVTGVGFEPDLVIFVCAGLANGDIDSQEAHAIMSYGAAHNGGGITQRVTHFSSRDAQGAAEITGRLSTNRCCGQVFNGAISWEGELTAFGADGFTVTSRTGGSGSDEVGYIALKFGTQSVKIFDYDTPTSTGDDAVTGIGFQSQFVQLIMSTLAAAGSTVITGDAGAFGIFSMNGNAEYGNVIHSEDAADPTNTASLPDSKINLRPDDGSTTNDFIATGPGGSGSLDADGFTLNFTAVDTGTVRKWWGIAIEEAAAVGGANPKGPLGMPLHGPMGGPIG